MGGKYGDIRASINKVKLNAYLANSVSVVAVPVTIKQFKVRRMTPAGLTDFDQTISQFGQVRASHGTLFTLWIHSINSLDSRTRHTS